MTRSGPSESGKGKGRCVWSLWVTIGHIRVTVGHLRVTVGHPRVTIGQLRVTIGHLRVNIGHLWVTIGHLRITIGFFSTSKHKANTTELHPKVRQTCNSNFVFV